MMRSGTMLEEALERPGPSAGMARCCVRRIKNFLGTSCVFELQLERGHMMLLAARKRKKSKVWGRGVGKVWEKCGSGLIQNEFLG